MEKHILMNHQDTLHTVVCHCLSQQPNNGSKLNIKILSGIPVWPRMSLGLRIVFLPHFELPETWRPGHCPSLCLITPDYHVCSDSKIINTISYVSILSWISTGFTLCVLACNQSLWLCWGWHTRTWLFVTILWISDNLLRYHCKVTHIQLIRGL